MSKRLEERLRCAAKTYRRLGIHTAEYLFLKAADTIYELQTENNRLREERDHLRRLALELGIGVD